MCGTDKYMYMKHGTLAYVYKQWDARCRWTLVTVYIVPYQMIMYTYMEISTKK